MGRKSSLICEGFLLASSAYQFQQICTRQQSKLNFTSLSFLRLRILIMLFLFQILKWLRIFYVVFFTWINLNFCYCRRASSIAIFNHKEDLTPTMMSEWTQCGLRNVRTKYNWPWYFLIFGHFCHSHANQIVKRWKNSSNFLRTNFKK